jgi:two-component system cell cycle sensor histidine kinase/response regulator CckA
VVDDEQSTRESVLAFLAGEPYEVLEAESARRALEIAERRPVDLLITNAMLPNMKGRDLAHRLAVLRPAVKLLFLSGYSSETLIVHGIFPPGAYFLGKPLAEKVVRMRVKAILDQGLPWKAVSGG